jgi:hypothetical protein
MIVMSKKLLFAGLLITVAAIALGTAYFSFSHKENPMEQTHIENTKIPTTDAPAPACAVYTNVPPVDTPATIDTKVTNTPPIDALAPAHTETATFAMG